jgi:isopentenyl-diphosphate Delta-isomerase
MKDLIALVNPNDEITRFAEKQMVHIEGLLHRAFSVFVFNSQGELMIHQRAHEKYHSPSLWTNTCCSHLPPGMEMEEAVHSRLIDEMGFDTQLKFVEKFHYKIEFDNGLTENEIDHIYVGLYDGKPFPNNDEVAGYKWISLPDLKEDIGKNPDQYTYWFKYIIDNHYNSLVQELVKRGLNKTLESGI